MNKYLKTLVIVSGIVALGIAGFREYNLRYGNRSLGFEVNCDVWTSAEKSDEQIKLGEFGFFLGQIRENLYFTPPKVYVKTFNYKLKRNSLGQYPSVLFDKDYDLAVARVRVNGVGQVQLLIPPKGTNKLKTTPVTLPLVLVP